MTGKKILLTGGNGFIGAKLLEKLVSLDNDVFLILRKSSNRMRIAHLLDNVSIYETDLQNTSALDSIVARVRPDIIYHLAAHGVYTYASLDEENIDAILQSNIQGTLNLLNAAKKINLNVFINTGSCFEYGSREEPFNEDDVLQPCNIYGVSKVASTLLAKNFSETLKIPIITVRPFTVYGPGQDEKRFIYRAITQCLSDEDISLTKEEIIRDYVYIDDVINAYIHVADNSGKAIGEVLNISTGRGYSLQKVAEEIIKLTGAKKSKINIGAFPIRQGEVLSLVGSAKKIEAMLNWEAAYSLSQGLKETIAWVRKNG